MRVFIVDLWPVEILLSFPHAFFSVLTPTLRGQSQCLANLQPKHISFPFRVVSVATPHWSARQGDTRLALDWSLNALWLSHFSQTPCSCPYCGGGGRAPWLILWASCCYPRPTSRACAPHNGRHHDIMPVFCEQDPDAFSDIRRGKEWIPLHESP